MIIKILLAVFSIIFLFYFLEDIKVNIVSGSVVFGEEYEGSLLYGNIGKDKMLLMLTMYSLMCSVLVSYRPYRIGTIFILISIIYVLSMKNKNSYYKNIANIVIAIYNILTLYFIFIM